jgi:H+/gluconate symporter-like permease
LDILIVLAALLFLTVVAYRGFSVILFAPVAALLAVLLSDPKLLLPFYSGVFMERTAGFLKLYFPIFLLGAVFGKLMEVSGFARSIIRVLAAAMRPGQAMLSIVLVCAILTYGGVSLFVVAFAVYPFAAELFRASAIPKRLIPATIALGAFTFTMDALPGSPQIQNLIPTTFFKTDAWAAPWLGTAGALFLFITGMTYLEWRRRRAVKDGEGYGEHHINEMSAPEGQDLPHPLLAALPLVAVGVLNKLFTIGMPAVYGTRFDFGAHGITGPPAIDIATVSALWAVQGALFTAILLIAATAWRRVRASFQQATGAAVGGAMLACLNTASEYGFGAVIALLPGFRAVNEFLTRTIEDTLLNIAVTTNALAAITGSASGGLSIVLGSMAQSYIERAQASGIPLEVVHRVAAMASGGMDTLPHNGAVITLLAVTGLTHRQSYPDIFAMTIFKVATAFFAIALYRLFGVQ